MEQAKPLLYQGKIGPMTLRGEIWYVAIGAIVMGIVLVVASHDPSSASDMRSWWGVAGFLIGAAIIAIPCAIIVFARRWLWRHRPL